MTSHTFSLEVEDLSVHIDNKRVLSNVYFSCEPGTLMCVMGPNGAGKSTLFKALLGIVERSSGSILFEGKPLQEVKALIAYLPQKDKIDWSFPATVYDVVLMGRYAHKRIFERISKHDKEIALAAMERMDISELRNRQISQLSGGQQQRTFIARALCQDANYLFLDEPFVGVDTVTESKTVDILHELSSTGKIMMVVHHDLSTVRNYFDQIMLLNQRMVAYGPVRETFSAENISATYGGQLSILQKAGLLKRGR